MKKFTQALFTSLFLIIAAPAFSGSGLQAIQIFECEFNDDATADQVLKVASIWREAARKTNGGENMEVAIRFPIAEGTAADGDFRMVIVTPTFAEWGAFTDAYEGSEVAGVDEQLYKLADCGQSTIWEGMVIK